MVARDASSVSRLAYITRRVRLLQELGAFGVVKLFNIPGKRNPADMLTKWLKVKATIKEYLARLYNRSMERA